MKNISIQHLRWPVLFFFMAMAASPSLAQCPPTWTCNQKCNTGPCSGLGPHLDASNNIVMTEDGSNTTTSIWDKNYVSMTQAFTIEFDLNLGTRDALGGEGMTFMMQTLKNNPTAAELSTYATAIGYGGGNLGQGCAPKTANNSVSVEFDTYDNTNDPACATGCHTDGDLSADHISINKENCNADKMDGTIAPAVQASPTSANIEDGAWHKVRIVWVPDPPITVLGPATFDRYCDNACCSTPGTFVNVCGQTVAYSSLTCNANYTCKKSYSVYTTGTMKVFFDNMTTPRISKNFDVHKVLNPNGSYGTSGTFDPNNPGANSQLNVMFGFTASTEGKTNFQAIKGFKTLPVKYSGFSLHKASANAVNVIWETYEEKNSEWFIVQRSLDGIHWEDAGTVAASGNTSYGIRYSFLDENRTARLLYYRLKQVDRDGRANYSPVESIDLRSKELLVEVFPNPVYKGEKIRLINSGENQTIEIFDMNGKMIWLQEHVNESEITIPTESFIPGMHIIKVYHPTGIVIKKIAIL